MPAEKSESPNMTITKGIEDGIEKNVNFASQEVRGGEAFLSADLNMRDNQTEINKLNDSNMSSMTDETVWNGILRRCEKPADDPLATINIGVLGNSDVGKTSLANKFRERDFKLG